MHGRVDPADLILPRRPVAGDGMDMAVDQSRREHGALRIDDGLGVGGVDLREAADGCDPAADGDEAVGVEDRPIEIAAEQEPDILDDELVVATAGYCLLLSHGLCSPPRP